MYKKGELTTKQLVTLIILILSFSVVLFFLFKLDLGETTNKEICHNSIVLKDKSALSGGSIDCKTNYLCISAGGECENINPTATVEVEATQEAVIQAIAEEMADCWWMFGEDNEFKYSGSSVARSVDCAICSVIDFDDKIKSEVESFSYDDFYNELSEIQKSDSQTYLQYLYATSDSNQIITNYQSQVIDAMNELTIYTNKKYSVITGIDNKRLDVLGANDEWLKVYLIPSEKLSETKCDKFITKA